MKINIRPENCKFYVNKEKRKIVCVLEATRHRLIDFMEDNPHMEYFMLDDCLIMPDRFVGVATCSADDEWDEAFGRLLAFKRVKEAFYTAFFNRANKFVSILNDKLNELVADCNAIGIKIDDSLKRREKEIENYFTRDNKELEQA